MPAEAERSKEHPDETRAVAKTTLHRLPSRRDIPVREKTLWRMLYEAAARAAELLALNVEDLDLDNRRAPVRSKGGALEWVYWGSGTAHLLPDGSTRTHGALFLAERRPVPRPPARGRRHLPAHRTPPPRLRPRPRPAEQALRPRPAPAPPQRATHLGEAEVPLQLVMGKTRHKNPRTALRYVKPGSEAITKVTEHLAPCRRTHYTRSSTLRWQRVEAALTAPRIRPLTGATVLDMNRLVR